MIAQPLGILQSSGRKNAYRNLVDYTEIQAYRSVVCPHLLLGCTTVVSLFDNFCVLKQPSEIVQIYVFGIK